MNCPNCRAGDISPLTNRCELCGFAPEGLVAVEAPKAEALEDIARQELAAQFALDTFLGRGADSAVFLAREQGSTRQVVIKVLPRPADGQEIRDERFRAAVQAVSELEHPHIVPVSDFGWTDHLYWYSMQHVRGHSLRTFLRSRGPLDLRICLRLVAQVASALDYAHRRGIVHGALKPENVLIDAEGWVHVCDLLVSRTLEAPLPGPPRQLTPSKPEPKGEHQPYVAPEELRTAQSDQFALAVLVYECLAGSLPPDQEDAGIAPASLLAGTRPDIPAQVTLAVRRALSRQPIDRFPGVLDFVAALESTAVALPDARPSGRTSATVLMQTDWKPPDDPVRRRLLLAGAVVGLAVVGVLLWPLASPLFRRQQGEQPVLVIHTFADSTAVPTARADTTAQTPPPAPVARQSPAKAAPDAGPARAPQSPSPGSAPSAAPAGTNVPAPRRERRGPAAAQDAAPQAADSGRLFVNAMPWGQVYLDGALVGNTPKANLAVTAGRHTVRVAREGFEPVERVVQVGAGQVVRLTDLVLVERKP